MPCLIAARRVYASLFTDRAIMYRRDKKFDDMKVGISIAIQKMVRSDKAVSGVAFSLDTETGFRDAVIINASYGLGEAIVQGATTPDEYMVHKPTLLLGKKPIIKKKRGSKEIKMVYAKKGSSIESVPVAAADQVKFCLTDEEILEIARRVTQIEAHYSELKKEWTPVDVEWAKDGNDGLMYMVQARPETVHAHESVRTIIRYRLDVDSHTPEVIIAGQSIGQHIVSGKARLIDSYQQIDQIKPGEILVTKSTDPNWVPIMKKAAGIITNQGGRTCHAAIVSRELNIPAIVGTGRATEIIKNGQEITIDCSQGSVGFVYKGALTFTKIPVDLETLPKSPVDILLNLADPDRAFSLSFLPVAGVGLARMEFIISNAIKIHPMALLHFDKITDSNERAKIDQLTIAYPTKSDFYRDTLAQGIGMIAAAFYPRPVIVRLSDFKSNEYRDLIGGQFL